VIAPVTIATPRHFSKGGEFAAGLATAGPWVAALVAGVNLLGLMGPDWAGSQASFLSWLLLAVPLVCVFLASRMIWRGVHSGRLSPVRLLAVTAAPWALGVLLAPVAYFNAQYQLMSGAPADVYAPLLVETRAFGKMIAWSLLGSTLLALSVAAFLWRSPGARWKGWLLAWAALAPFTLFVVYGLNLTDTVPAFLRPAIGGLALVALPFYLALAGAALGKPPAAEPGADWALWVPIAAVLGFMVVASLVHDLALLDAVLAGARVPEWQGREQAIGSTVRSTASFGLIGLALLMLPALALQARNSGVRHALGADFRRRARILLAGLALVGLDALANGHLVATLEGPAAEAPAVREEAVEPESFRPPPPPSRAESRKLAPIELPSMGTPEVGMPEGEVEGVEGGVLGGVIGGDPGGMATPDEAGQTTASPAPAPVPPHRAIVPFVVLQAQAVSEPQIDLPVELRSKLVERQQTQVVLTLKLVIDERGEVTGVFLLKGSGLGQLDDYLIGAAGDWRFRPFEVNGVATPVATAWTVVYRL
jgi:protein TonB